MATIAKLTVDLRANSAQLVKELAKARNSVGAWAKRIRKQASVVAKAIGAAGVAAVGAIAVVVNRQAAEIDKLAKKAAALRIDTGELQKLRYQAELSGVSTNQLDKSLQRMLKTVGDGKAGLSTAVRAFDQLGLSAEQLSQMSADQQFNAIAGALKNVSSRTDQTRIAMDIFGRSGADLVNTLLSDLSATGAEFDKLGIRITSQQAAMVEAYNDAKTKLSTIWDGFLNQITVAVAPAFQAVVDYITQVTLDMGGMDKVASKVVGSLATGVGFVADAFRGWQIIIKGIQIAFGKLAQIALRSIDSIYGAYANLRELVDDSFQRSDLFSGLADGFEIETNKMSKQLDNLLNAERPSIAIKSKIDEFQKSAAEKGALTKGGASGLAGAAADFDKYGVAINDSTRSLSEFKDQVKQTTSGVSDLYKKLFGDTDSSSKKTADEKDDFAAKPRQIRDINFEMYAKAAKVAKDQGNESEYNRQLKFAGEQAKRSKASTFLYDQTGQKDVLNRLSGGNAEKIGTMEFKIQDASATVSGKPSELKNFADTMTKVLSGEAKAVSIA
ncbi:MAG: hypothetical protein OQK12_17290 [Motiliproteus sp.]|nr:hypothetical protein [Motiliproteus sp.]MCW9051229.1 hypothetical protein [Motiliproteus sp.]